MCVCCSTVSASSKTGVHPATFLSLSWSLPWIQLLQRNNCFRGITVTWSALCPSMQQLLSPPVFTHLCFCLPLASTWPGQCQIHPPTALLPCLLHCSNDRALLKNLGCWLGLLTFAKSKPLLSKELDIKRVSGIVLSVFLSCQCMPILSLSHLHEQSWLLRLHAASTRLSELAQQGLASMLQYVEYRDAHIYIPHHFYMSNLYSGKMICRVVVG